MKKITFLFVMLAISGRLLADEVEDYCNLTRAQANTQAATLAWPSLFASFGNPYLVADTTLVGGASQSLSGFIRGLMTSSAANYQCHFYGANKSLRDSVLHLDDRIFLSQADAKRPILTEALALAEENARLEKQLFEMQNSTISDLSEAYATRDNLQSSLLALNQKYSTLREIPISEMKLSLKEQAAEATNYQAKAASLASTINALSAWDVVGSGGFQYDVKSGQTGGFWSVNLSYSFGQIPSTISAGSIDRLSRKYADSQYDSAQNLYLRFVRGQRDVLAAEINNKNYIANRLNTIHDLLQKAKRADSAQAKKAQRNLRIQELTQKAELVGSTIKIDELQKWTGASED